MQHDSQTYPDAESFDPERFMSPTPQRDPRGVAYGFGRRCVTHSLATLVPAANGCVRRCPGMHLANAFVFLVISRTIALFILEPERREGEVVWPVLRMLPGIVGWVIIVLPTFNRC